ncbi:hypothetical protein BOX15_Mlig016262g2 [Macrostomum lignano]|uniref:UspA domain-containing protein n=1 Tax=Macrostomum lignano TaxID=282301 RepID=A0A267GE65_9PLAT|nr:hypothetical protein BOX15_Mlig016262g2 [Macrostomum lignano]
MASPPAAIAGASPESKAQLQHSKASPTADEQAVQNRSILIAIDRSRHSERALRWYASKIHSNEDRVVFVNVTEPPDLALGFGMAGAAVAEIYTKAVEETVEAAKRLAVNVKTICRSFGIEKIRFLERISHSPGQAIIEAAEEEQADLIILGSRGVGVLRRTFLGSVSDYVLHHSRRSAVLVVPAEQHHHSEAGGQHYSVQGKPAVEDQDVGDQAAKQEG